MSVERKRVELDQAAISEALGSKRYESMGQPARFGRMGVLPLVGASKGEQVVTDRLNSFTVILEKDLRDDDAKPLMTAIRQLRGVLSVEGNVIDVGDHVAEERARARLIGKLFVALEKPAKRE